MYAKHYFQSCILEFICALMITIETYKKTDLKPEMSDNPSRIPFHLGGPRVTESDRKFSRHVSRALDCLGKSKNIVKSRVEYCTEKERCMNIEGRNITSCIIAGSKGEGLTAPFESDLDIMSVENCVICADNTATIRSHPAPYIVFEADRRNTSPGYTKLRLGQSDRLRGSLFDNSLLEDGYGNIFLSSDFYVKDIENKIDPSTVGPSTGQILVDRIGPSIPSVGILSQDYVKALPCFIPEIEKSFIARHRRFGWPTNDQLTEISFLEGHVVAVGYKGSHTAYLEWRICYTKTERFLMRNLNKTQTKIYILLKMVAKTYIQYVCKEITSYVLKNIVLWQAEFVSRDTFNEELLVNSLIQALFFLRNCIINNSLPSYMIPERNLFSVKLDLGQRQKLVILLTELIYKGGGLLMGCERLRGTMLVLYKTPAVAEQYGWKRDMIEKLYLWKDIIVGDEQMHRLSFTDATCTKLNMIYIGLILPDMFSLRLQGYNALSLMPIFMRRQTQWLS